MSLHDPLTPPPNPGAATVADLQAMDGAQALGVMLLRDWFDGPEGRTRVEGVFAEAFGPAGGDMAREAWADFAALLTSGTRRPVMRHAVTCRCVGADEAVIAQVVTLAARGEREDAMFVLSLLVPGDRLLSAVQTAERAGIALLRLTAGWRRDHRVATAPSRQIH
ncbi:hypothetical protein [uncultured Jannaschia sp.]|uniref:hypothetical protein n=1 Tax=uncultured Jannaschia sp. TaxID=293347 RepID=UPI002607FDE6|nr:hypothetical protein [uncultured Jannaschia sp.]